jgi:hypothetical protein
MLLCSKICTSKVRQRPRCGASSKCRNYARLRLVETAKMLVITRSTLFIGCFGFISFPTNYTAEAVIAKKGKRQDRQLRTHEKQPRQNALELIEVHRLVARVPPQAPGGLQIKF